MSERDAHPDEGTIHAWLDRQLDDASAATLEAHLQRCDDCAERVAEARGLIAGTSRILSSLDIDASPSSDKAAVESWRPVVLPTTRARGIPAFRLTPARSAIAAVLVVAVATAIVREHERPSSKLASIAAESAAVASAPATAPALTPAPSSTAGAAVASVPPPAVATAPAIAPAAPAIVQLDTMAGTRVAAARTFAKAQRETTVNADLARVARVPAPAASTPTEQAVAAAKASDNVAGGVASAAAQQRTIAGFEAPQCYRVESATGTAATWGPVALPFVIALDRPATGNSARVLTPAGQDDGARAVFERRGDDSLLFTLRRIGYTGTLAVGAPGDVRAGVMRSAPAAMQLEANVVTAAPTVGGERRALRKPESAAKPSADAAPASPAVPVVVRRVECKE